MSQIKLFRNDNFSGGDITLNDSEPNLVNRGFNDTISSLIVESGVWTLYEDIDFKGNSITVASQGGPSNNGKYPAPTTLAGRNDAYSSVRRNA
jgi:Beta/Gamma crystallin